VSAARSEVAHAKANHAAQVVWDSLEAVKKPDNQTLDFGTRYRCMLVALDDAAAKICARAVVPLEAVRTKDLREACAKLLEVLPLIVVLPEGADPTGVAEVVELAGACGAEVITVALPVDGRALGDRILEALGKAEARRVPR